MKLRPWKTRKKRKRKGDLGLKFGDIRRIAHIGAINPRGDVALDSCSGDLRGNLPELLMSGGEALQKLVAEVPRCNVWPPSLRPVTLQALNTRHNLELLISLEKPRRNERSTAFLEDDAERERERSSSPDSRK